MILLLLLFSIPILLCVRRREGVFLAQEQTKIINGVYL